jgi:F-type H+-transporting ATPase subunit delta
VAVAHRIYADALLQAAKEEKSVDRVRSEFAEFVGTAAESAELRNLLRNPQIETRAKKDALGAILEGADETFRNFVLLTADKNRVGELEDIHEEWERLLAEEERILEVELTTAIELSDEDAARIVKQIEDAAGRRVEARRSVDPDLIGGLVLQAGSVRLDASVRGRLNDLRTELLSAG